VKEAFVLFIILNVLEKLLETLLKIQETNPEPPLGRGLSLEICVASFWCCVREKKFYFFENFSKLF